jgi:lysophospholipid acyltransferase (LPLAT)-like uncharacterized protein
MSASPSPSAHRPAKTSGVVVPHRAKWHQRLLAALIYALVQTVSATIRFELEDRSGFFHGAVRDQMIFALWHNRLALSATLYRRYVLCHKRERRIAGMVSASRDGGLLAEIFGRFGIEPVRGSSSRRGAQAVREMVTRAEAGYDLAITPDGPRGPCYTVQEGVIATAQLTGLAIVPVSYQLNWKLRLKSWDRFQIPLPFGRCRVTVGHALRVPRETSDEEREQLRRQLETELRAITRDDAP